MFRRAGKGMLCLGWERGGGGQMFWGAWVEWGEWWESNTGNGGHQRRGERGLCTAGNMLDMHL